MATGGLFSRSIQGGSDEQFDFLCTSCENQNKTVEAAHYCADCGQFYCKVCLQVHSSIPALKNHNVLGRNNVKSWGIQTRSSLMPTEICSQHSGKTVEMFCGKHNLLCCHVCVSKNHRTCEGMDFIPDVAQGISQSPEFVAVNKNIERVMSDMDQTKTTRQQKKAALGKSRKNVLQSIKDFRKHVNKVFDTLEKKVTDDMETLYKDTDKDIQDDIDACDDFMAKLEQMKQQLDANSATNESQMFILVKKCQLQMMDGDQLIQVLATPRKDRIQFINDPEIERFLAKITSLGKLEVFSTVPEVKKQKKAQAYKADNGIDYNVRIKGENNVCNISGSCQMADGAILLTDFSNNKLKRLDTSYTLIDHCNIPASPRAVCCIDHCEAAVTNDRKTIYFVSVGRKMKVTRSIKINQYAWGIAYNNNQLYVSDSANKVYIYNMSGTCLRTLYKDNNGVEMFSDTRHIAVSSDGTKIYVADSDKGLMTMDSSGQLLATFSDKQLGNAEGVFVDNDGSVFVCGNLSHNVIQVDEWGKQKIGEVATEADGVLRPWSVCIDKLKSTMMVTTCHQGTVRVFDIK